MPLARLFDFVAGTIIQDGQVDAEFNQLIQALTGVLDNDVSLKFTHAANPVLNVNQLGAGLVQRWQVNTVDKARIANDGLWEWLQTAGQLPAKVNQFTTLGNISSSSNTLAEISLLSGGLGPNPSPGSSLTTNANTIRQGSVFTFDVKGLYAATAGPTVTLRVKFGGVTILTTTAFVIPNTASGLWNLKFDVHFETIGATAAANIRFFRFECANAVSGIVTPTVVYATGNIAVNTTVDALWEVTWQFGTANAGNSTGTSKTRIDRAR